MKYDDEIITITLMRGQFACSLGERGLMVSNWNKFKKALEKELNKETASHDDGHTTHDALGDLLVDTMLDRADPLEYAGLKKKSDSGKNECWPFEESWFNGE